MFLRVSFSVSFTINTPVTGHLSRYNRTKSGCNGTNIQKGAGAGRGKRDGGERKAHPPKTKDQSAQCIYHCGSPSPSQKCWSRYSESDSESLSLCVPSTTPSFSWPACQLESAHILHGLGAFLDYSGHRRETGQLRQRRFVIQNGNCRK